MTEASQPRRRRRRRVGALAAADRGTGWLKKTEN
jgi:hypothetical protein